MWGGGALGELPAMEDPPPFEFDDDDMLEKVGIITGGASGK